MISRFPNLEFEYFQSNVEGDIINILHKVGFSADGIVMNAGAYTHTSVAIRDAIAAITSPVVEVHISNILTREQFRHESIIGPVCKGSIMGFGLDSYRLGVESFLAPE
jgi:3-dehydroquinate dehydratase-2